MTLKKQKFGLTHDGSPLIKNTNQKYTEIYLNENLLTELYNLDKTIKNETIDPNIQLIRNNKITDPDFKLEIWCGSSLYFKGDPGQSDSGLRQMSELLELGLPFNTSEKFKLFAQDNNISAILDENNFFRPGKTITLSFNENENNKMLCLSKIDNSIPCLTKCVEKIFYSKNYLYK